MIAELVPDPKTSATTLPSAPASAEQRLAAAETGHGSPRWQVRQDPYLIHTVDGVEYKTKISTLRGDYRKPTAQSATACGCGRSSDFKPRPDDIFQERLYCIQWMRPKKEARETSTSSER